MLSLPCVYLRTCQYLFFNVTYLINCLGVRVCVCVSSNCNSCKCAEIFGTDRYCIRRARHSQTRPKLCNSLSTFLALSANRNVANRWKNTFFIYPLPTGCALDWHALVKRTILAELLFFASVIFGNCSFQLVLLIVKGFYLLCSSAIEWSYI